MTPITLITLSRQYGAGASELAAALGTRLGWRVLDDDIAHQVARRLRLPDGALIEWDEHAPTVMERIGQALIMGNPDLLVDPSLVNQPRAEDVVRVTREILVEAAATRQLLVVGHGASSLFRGRADALHLRLVAPIENRIRRIGTRRPSTNRECALLAQRIDADRAHYVREFYGRDVQDPLLYDLQINTSAIDLDESVELVLGLVTLRREQGAPR